MLSFFLPWLAPSQGSIHARCRWLADRSVTQFKDMPLKSCPLLQSTMTNSAFLHKAKIDPYMGLTWQCLYSVQCFINRCSDRGTECMPEVTTCLHWYGAIENRAANPLLSLRTENSIKRHHSSACVGCMQADQWPESRTPHKNLARWFDQRQTPPYFIS